jgi:tRNA threonylcarbamoyladenosine biosynthesis protein TsaE
MGAKSDISAKFCFYKEIFLKGTARMTSKMIVLKSLADTVRFGIQLGSMALPGDVICLDGELGAGKTTLTQAIAKGLDVPPTYYVTSPSFAILQEYPGRIPLYHMDFYRLNDSLDVENLGFEEYFYLAGLTVIEWSEKAMDLLPKQRLVLAIQIESDQRRIVHCTYISKSWEERLDQLLA